MLIETVNSFETLNDFDPHLMGLSSFRFVLHHPFPRLWCNCNNSCWLPNILFGNHPQTFLGCEICLRSPGISRGHIGRGFHRNTYTFTSSHTSPPIFPLSYWVLLLHHEFYGDVHAGEFWTAFARKVFTPPARVSLFAPVVILLIFPIPSHLSPFVWGKIHWGILLFFAVGSNRAIARWLRSRFVSTVVWSTCSSRSHGTLRSRGIREL